MTGVAGLLDGSRIGRVRRDGRLGGAVDGLIAGAVGSVALNVVTYLDITLRARPASGSPEQSAQALVEKLHIGLGPEDRAANRRSGLGPLLGYATGVLSGAALTLVGLRHLPKPVAAGLFGAGAMLASDGAMTALGVTDPRRWSPKDWLSDIVPHLAYGLAAVETLGHLQRVRRRH
ncbi:hypothetical protein ACN28C_22785 [Plantactinospora sp. WMMC1484]|uniref:hypothetical protein n=1 Tax=Plantactinospora sp. WMMC1484 TaxID=3404122 RepID=UPI003BF60691